MSSNKTQYFTDENFERAVLQSDVPVLVDFWAPWCAPCRVIGPTIDELAAEYDGIITVGKVNIDENPITPARYQVRSIPALVIFKDGQPLAGIAGLAPKSRIEELLRQSLQPAASRLGAA